MPTQARLYDFDAADPLAQDLKKRGLDCLTLRIRFPPDFPTQPPFVRVLRPRLRESTGYVLNGGTEPAFSSPLNDIKQSGDFVCARKGCDAVLFRTDTKYDSGTGWPSFWDPVDDNVKLEKGNFLSFMFGTECKCAKCDGHLGHRFDDGPIMKSGKRYCINGAALRFRENIGAGPPPDTFPDAPPL